MRMQLGLPLQLESAASTPVFVKDTPAGDRHLCPEPVIASMFMSICRLTCRRRATAMSQVHRSGSAAS